MREEHRQPSRRSAARRAATASGLASQLVEPSPAALLLYCVW